MEDTNDMGMERRAGIDWDAIAKVVGDMSAAHEARRQLLMGMWGTQFSRTSLYPDDVPMDKIPDGLSRELRGEVTEDAEFEIIQPKQLPDVTRGLPGIEQQDHQNEIVPHTGANDGNGGI
jgi:hypothetical protein